MLILFSVKMTLLKTIVKLNNKLLFNLMSQRYRSVISPKLLLPCKSQVENPCYPKKKNNCPTEPKSPWIDMRRIEPEYSNKITVVGAGAVGTAVVEAVLFQKICTNVVLIDNDARKLEGEVLEYHYSERLLHGCKIEGSTDMMASCNSKVIVVTAGARQKGNQTRLDVLKENIEIFQHIIPQLHEFSPNAIFLVVSNPVDVLSWVTWKLTNLPFYKIMGCGTYVDSMRFCSLLSKHLNCDQRDIHAVILGEHGNSQVPIWSSVYNKSEQLRKRYPDCGLCPDDPFYQIAEDVRLSGSKIRCLKGYTSTTVGLCVVDILKSLLYNVYKIRPVSMLAQGLYGIDKEVFLSVLCQVDSNGIFRVYNQPIDEHEQKLMQASANTLHEATGEIKFC